MSDAYDYAEHADEPAEQASATEDTSVTGEEGKSKPQDRKLVRQIAQTIKADKRYFKKSFQRMRRDMFVATNGYDKANWNDSFYKANFSGRHVKQKTAALYAKNPKATAKRPERLDFVIWDETPESLQLAIQTMQMAQAAAQAVAGQVQPHPLTGAPVPVEPQLPPGFEQAQALVADFQQGMAKRQMADKIGKTLEILFGHAMREQKPLDFKRGMKSVVRRACTTGVGYVELEFQREYGPRPGLEEQLADSRSRLDHLRALAEGLADGDYDEDAPERAELEFSIEALQQEPEVLMREGLIVDYPRSTHVIPDRNCQTLDGFVGAEHVTLEYVYTCDRVKELFGVDVSGSYVGYRSDDKTDDQSELFVRDDDDGYTGGAKNKRASLVCVWKHYHKPSGLVYYVADGYPDFLRPPAAPNVFVEDFWPVYALTFNAVENEDELFPPSDVTLLLDMQTEHNRARQGQREHRDAARPRWVYPNGAFEEDDSMRFKKLKPLEALGMNMDPSTKIGDILQVVPIPGVDPNLYETGQIFQDTQITVGAQQAQFGGVAKATATESAIAANSTTASDNSSTDDLDSFLSTIARGGGQILLREMSEEQVKKIVGDGAVWPEMTLSDIAEEIYLEVEAGSTGKPNQAVEINNWKEMLPFLIQIGNISPTWLARETLRRLDDRMDLTGAIVEGIPAIVAQNRSAQPIPGDPAAQPDKQGEEGANNGPQPPGQVGSEPAFGSNQV